MLLYTSKYQLLPALFDTLYVSPVPSRFTFRLLQQLGFKSSGMRDLIPFLQGFGFLDATNAPTLLYVDYKQASNNKEFVSVCAKKAYSAILPKVTALSDTFLEDVFAQEFTHETPATIHHAVRTFLALNSYAPFAEEASKPAYSHSLQMGTKHSKSPININIHLPETDNEAVYRVIFTYLKEILT